MDQNSYFKRLWYMWGPIVIKMFIAWATIFVAQLYLASVQIMQESGGDIEALRKLYQDTDKMSEMSARLYEQITSLAIPIEGIAAFLTIPVMMIMIFVDMKREKKSGTFHRSKVSILFFFVTSLMCFLVSVVLNNLIAVGDLASVSEDYEKTMKLFYSPPLWIQIVCLSVLIPVSEELVFRGMIFKRIRRGDTFLRAAVYSSVVFGITHGNIVQTVYAALMGLVLAYAYEVSGTILAPIVGHILANLFAVLATYYGFYQQVSGPVASGILTVAGTMAASSLYVMTRRIEGK